jgi:diguanylate cyclase (GGDEF)-like protein
MDPIALARGRQELLRVGAVLIMVGAMLVGTNSGDWLPQCVWIAVYTVVAVIAVLVAFTEAGRAITGRRWQIATAVIDVVALSGFQFLTTGGYVPLLVVGLLPLMIILQLSWRPAAVILLLSIVAFATTVMEDPVIADQIGQAAAWFLVALYAYLCCTAFLATYVQNRQFDEIATQRDETARFAHQAMHDPLTGLPNRSFVLARTSDALTRAQDVGLSAVLFIDLDKVKAINDSLGHDAGDQMICAAAQRLQRAVRPQDVVARLGGDEFVALLFGPMSRGELDIVSDRLHTALAEPARIDDTSIRMTASIGITVVGEHDERDAAAILHDADVAMYSAKTAGRGTTQHFGDDPLDAPAATAPPEL